MLKASSLVSRSVLSIMHVISEDKHTLAMSQAAKQIASNHGVHVV